MTIYLDDDEQFVYYRLIVPYMLIVLHQEKAKKNTRSIFHFFLLNPLFLLARNLDQVHH